MSIDIFDRDLLIDRRMRQLSEREYYDFLFKRAEEDIADRLDTILRSYENVLQIGSSSSKTLAGHEKISNMTYLDSHPVFFDSSNWMNIVGDPEFLPFKAGSFDLAVSPLSLVFINDLPGVLLQLRQCLKPDGLFIGNFAGGQTLFELREAFALAEEEMEGGASPRVAPFLDVRDGGALLQRAGFSLPVTDSEVVKISYETPLHLMRDLRGMGATNILFARRQKPLRRSTLMRMCEIYADRFGDCDGRIPASFEFVSLTGWCPHESQQKPLSPGSASMRLSEALGVEERSAGEKAGGTS